MQFYPILGKKCNLWKLRKRFFAHKESNKGQVKGGIQMAKRGENIHKRKDGRGGGALYQRAHRRRKTRMGVPVWICVQRSPGRTDQAESSVRILSALREVDAFFRTGSALAYGSQAECQRIHICSLSVHSAQIFSSCFRQSAGLKYDGFFAGTSFSSNSIAHRPEPQATWRILGTGMSWDAAANLQVCCTSAPHAAHRDMRQTATHTETRTTTLDPDRTGFSPGISFVRTNHP